MLVHPTAPTRPQQQSQQRRERRLEQYERVHSLRHQGVTVRDIAHHVGIGRRTVFRYLASPQFPERKPRPRYSGHSCLDPYKPYLVEQWTGKRGQTKQLFSQIQQQGYSGSYLTVARYTHRFRQEQRQQLNEGDGRGHALGMNQSQSSPLTARRATKLVLQRPEEQKNEEETLVTQLKAQHPDIEAAITLARGFAHLVRQRQPDLLDPWLKQAANCSLFQFQKFADSLQEDYAAVKAGVTLETSNGQVEGQVSRLKMLKRQMYGRAGFDLLRRRVLFAS